METDWGVCPVLFHIGKTAVPAYSVFVLAGLLAGAFVFYREAKREDIPFDHGFYLLFAALLGGIAGSKIPSWVMNYRAIIHSWPDISPMLSGRTIVGGLIGGLAATVWIRKKLKIQIRIGNPIAPAVALGMAIGRMGCFLRGCCYGKSTGLIWGVDFGDGIPRHPTQIYDGLFNLLVFFYLMRIRRKVTEPGRLFDFYLALYFSFRFVAEFWRQEPTIFWGLTAAQIVSVSVVFFTFGKRLLSFQRKEVRI